MSLIALALFRCLSPTLGIQTNVPSWRAFSSKTATSRYESPARVRNSIVSVPLSTLITG